MIKLRIKFVNKEIISHTITDAQFKTVKYDSFVRFLIAF